eukprot:COSAG05_NODE_5250_length_1225_cov_4.557726_1_plen_40_part_00
MTSINGAPRFNGLFENVQEALQVARRFPSAVIELAEIDV